MLNQNITLSISAVFLFSAVAGGTARADWRAETFALEPARIDDIVLAKPKGWTLTAIPNGYQLARPDLKATVVLSIGETPHPEGRDFDLDAAIQSVAKLVNATRVLSPAVSTRCLHRETIIERQGKSGTSYLALNVLKGDWTSWLLTGMLGTQEEKELTRIRGQLMLNTIVHSVARVGEKAGQPFPPQSIVGLWEDVVGQGYTKRRHGNIVGSATSGTANTYLLGKDRKYHRRRDTFSSGQIISGHAVSEERGTYETDGATIVFHPESCVVEWYETNGTRTMRRQCASGEFPQTVLIVVASAGKRLSLRGQGLSGGRLGDCDNVTRDFTPVEPDR